MQMGSERPVPGANDRSNFMFPSDPLDDLDPGAGPRAGVALAHLQHPTDPIRASSGKGKAVSARRSIGVFVLALAITGWNCGNVGPVVGPLTKDFDIGLGRGGAALGHLLLRRLRGRQPDRRGARAEDPGAVGNLGVLRALDDRQPDLRRRRQRRRPGGRAGRSPALAFGLAAVFVPAYARVMGGVKLVGLFGAGLTLGVAAASSSAACSQGAGVDWRVAFWITAALAAISLPILPNERVEVQRAASEGEGLAREALTNQAWWRVQLLGIATLNLPLIVGAWLVHYLITGVRAVGGRGRGALLRALRDLGGDARRRRADDGAGGEPGDAGGRRPRRGRRRPGAARRERIGRQRRSGDRR